MQMLHFSALLNKPGLLLLCLILQMAKMDLNEDDEKVNIETIFWSAMDMLSDDDKKLPQASCLSFL